MTIQSSRDGVTGRGNDAKKFQEKGDQRALYLEIPTRPEIKGVRLSNL